MPVIKLFHVSKKGSWYTYARVQNKLVGNTALQISCSHGNYYISPENWFQYHRTSISGWFSIIQHLSVALVMDGLDSEPLQYIKSILWNHYNDGIMSVIAFQITSLTSVCSTVYSGADQIKHESSASLAFVRGIHRGPVNSTHKWPVTRKMFPFNDVIMMSMGFMLCYNACPGSYLIYLPPLPQPHSTPNPWTNWPPCLQMTLLNAFSWIKSFVLLFKFHRSLLLIVQMTICQHVQH